MNIKRINTALAAIILIPLFIPLLASADGELFTRYLQKGDSGNEVLLLQKILNSDSETQVSASGKGSSGFETDFFGELTKQAVIKYQKKNNLGTKYGFFTLYSGALDDKTRDSLNGKVEDAQSATSTPATIQQQRINEIYRSSNVSTLAPFIQSISPSSVTNGDYVTISGRNFSTSTPNTVRMTYNNVSATSTDGKTLQVKVESSLQSMFNDDAKKLSSSEKSDVKKKIGEVPLFITVQNAKGTSNPFQIYLKLK